MKKKLRTFINDESGAITVDWIVITAALVALALAILSTVEAASLAVIPGWFAQ